MQAIGSAPAAKGIVNRTPAVEVVDVTAPFSHIGLLYRDEQRYVSAIAGFVHGAVSGGRPALVAVPQPRLDLLRGHFGTDPPGIAFADMSVAGRNPGRIIPTVLFDFAARHPGERVSIVGEPIWSGRTDDEYPACALHEALINNAFAGRDAAILCPYDAKNLALGVLADAQRTHPLIADGGDPRPSGDYRLDTCEAFNHRLRPPPADAVVAHFDSPAAACEMRELLRTQGHVAELPAPRVADLVTAVNELIANSVVHGGGSGTLTLWTEPEQIVCQVEDAGHLADPLCGLVPPAADAASGRGLILVNLLCDLVRVHTEPGHTTVRVFLNR